MNPSNPYPIVDLTGALKTLADTKKPAVEQYPEHREFNGAALGVPPDFEVQLPPDRYIHRGTKDTNV